MKERTIPGVLWISIVALGIMAFVHLVLAFKSGSAALFVSVVLEAILVFGLFHRWKWTYVLVLVFSILGVVVSLGKGPGQGFGVLVLNAIVVVPMLISTRYFFPLGEAALENEQAELPGT